MLKFNVFSQTLTRDDRFKPATDSVGYLKAAFDFLSDEWSGKTKIAVFRLGVIRYEKVLDSKNTCEVPHEVLVKTAESDLRIAGANKFFISVYGLKDAVRITTNEIKVDLSASGYGEAQNSSDPTPDQFSQFVSQVEDFAERAETAAENTEAMESYNRNEYANALKGYSSGKVVRVDDVSPAEHNVTVRVRSKNMWTTDLAYPINNIEYDSATQIFTFNGATNTTLYALPVPIPKGTTVTISAYIISGVVSSQGDGGLAFGGYNKKDSVSTWQGYINVPKMTNTDISGQTYTQTVQVTEDVTHFYAFIYASTATIHEPLKVRFQYEIGETATEYAPYIDPSTVTVKRCGKSIFAKSEDSVGSTSPYAWSSVLMAKISCREGNYVARCLFTQKGDAAKVALSVRDYDDYTISLKHVNSTAKKGVLEAPFTVAAGKNGFQIYLYSNYSGDLLTTDCLFEEIQVEVGSEATGYEEYKGVEYTPNENGIVEGITSLSPTMTVFTNTANTVVEVKYNQDINAVFEAINKMLGLVINGG